MIYIIPKKLVVYTINKNEKCNSRFIFPKEGYNLICLERDENVSTRNKVISWFQISSGSYFVGNCNKNNNLFITSEISNTGITLKIPNDSEVVDKFEYTGNSGKMLIEVCSPELGDGRFFTFLDIRSIVEILSYGGNVIDNKLPGTYSMEFKKTGNSFKILPHLENKFDIDQKNAKRIGELLGKPLTSKYEPGGLYIKKDSTLLLYLGCIGPNYLTYSNDYYNNYMFNSDNNIISPTNSHKEVSSLELCIELREEELDMWRGRDIKEVLEEMILSGKGARQITTKKGTGIKLEDLLFVEDDNFNVHTWIESRCLQSIGNSTSIKDLTKKQRYHLSFLPKKVQELKDKIFEFQKKSFLGDYSYAKDLLKRNGSDYVKKWLGKIKQTGKPCFRTTYTDYSKSDYFASDSKIFKKEDLNKFIESMVEDIYKELNL